MASLLGELARVAPSRLPVLLAGPTGSGKELMARELHRLSGRRGALVCLNCPAIAEGTMESELFGHVQGAYTGAGRDRAGAVESAEGGTLFLDEVADLPSRLQAALLRVLQEREVRRLGSDRTRAVDVRFVAASNRPLAALAQAGRFRPDLLFRLQGAELRLPSLEERRHEFPYLVPRLAAAVAAEAGLAPPELEPELPGFLAARPWPGNFRQLRHALERALWKSGPDRLGPGHFQDLAELGNPTRTWHDATRSFQRDLLLETLEKNEFSVTAAARCLGLARPALYAAARRLGLDLASIRNSAVSPPCLARSTPLPRDCHSGEGTPPGGPEGPGIRL